MLWILMTWAALIAAWGCVPRRCRRPAAAGPGTPLAAAGLVHRLRVRARLARRRGRPVVLVVAAGRHRVRHERWERTPAGIVRTGWVKQHRFGHVDLAGALADLYRGTGRPAPPVI